MRPETGRNIPSTSAAQCYAGEPIDTRHTTNACGTAGPDVHGQLHQLAHDFEQRASGLRELARSLPQNIPFIAERELVNLIQLTRRVLFA